MRRAFTLIELLVSITIIGVLISAAALGYDAARSNARDSQRIGDIVTLAKATDAFSDAYRGRFPKDLSDLTPYLTNGIIPKDPIGIPYNYWVNNVNIAYPSDPTKIADFRTTTANSNERADLAQVQYLFSIQFEQEPHGENLGNLVNICTLFPKGSFPSGPDCTKPTDQPTGTWKLQYYYPGPSCGMTCPGDQ